MFLWKGNEGCGRIKIECLHNLRFEFTILGRLMEVFGGPNRLDSAGNGEGANLPAFRTDSEERIMISCLAVTILFYLNTFIAIF